MRSRAYQPVLGGIVALATVLSIALIVLALFFNPVWVTVEQRRADSAAWTGFTDAQVQTVTGSILSDLYIGPPRFDVAVNGQPVLDARERQHMVDVRNVLLSFDAIGLLGLLVLVAAGLASGGARWFWRGVAIGATALAVSVVVGGVAFALFFDTAFEAMHELFFPSGSYTFDPRTERLVQLFPYAFWTETTIVLAIVGVAVAVGVALFARRRGGRPPVASVGAPVRLSS